MLVHIIGRRRKRRRPIIHYSEMMQLQTTPTDLVARDFRPKLDLTSGIPSLTPTDTPSTPISTGKANLFIVHIIRYPSDEPAGPIQLVPIVTRPHSFQFPIPVATIQSSSTVMTPQLPISPALPKYYPVSYKPVSLAPFDISRNVLSRTDRNIDNSVSNDFSRTHPPEEV